MFVKSIPDISEYDTQSKNILSLELVSFLTVDTGVYLYCVMCLIYKHISHTFLIAMVPITYVLIIFS